MAAASTPNFISKGHHKREKSDVLYAKKSQTSPKKSISPKRKEGKESNLVPLFPDSPFPPRLSTSVPGQWCPFSKHLSPSKHSADCPLQTNRIHDAVRPRMTLQNPKHDTKRQKNEETDLLFFTGNSQNRKRKNGGNTGRFFGDQEGN